MQARSWKRTPVLEAWVVKRQSGSLSWEEALEDKTLIMEELTSNLKLRFLK